MKFAAGEQALRVELCHSELAKHGESHHCHLTRWSLEVFSCQILLAFKQFVRCGRDNTEC